MLLFTQHLSLYLQDGDTPKLTPGYIGPFQISEVLSLDAYRLKLPSSMRCHNVFHISLLKPANFFFAQLPDREQPKPPLVRIENNQAYGAVDSILNHKPRSARSREQATSYLIWWAGYPLWESTNGPARNIEQDVPDEVTKYWAQLHRRGSFHSPLSSSHPPRSSSPAVPAADCCCVVVSLV